MKGFSLLALCFSSAALFAQAGTIYGKVVSRMGELPLPFGIVNLEGASRSMFANDSGQFVMRDVQPGSYRLTVKRIGYRPADIPIQVRAGVTDTVTIRLERVAVTLDGIVVSALPACLTPGPPRATDSTLSTIVAQLKLNSEQMRFLSQQYPHEYSLEVNRRHMIGETVANEDLPRLTTYPGKTKSSYAPGTALTLKSRGWVFEIPELIEVADPRFIAEHCWHFGGAHTLNQRDHFRVDVVASAKLRGVDIDGSFYVDAESFQVRRSIVRLSRRPDRIRGLLEFETTTDFQEILPSIPIIAHVRAVQTLDPKQRAGFTETIEEQHTFAFRFTGRKPGDAPITADSVREAVRTKKPDRD